LNESALLAQIILEYSRGDTRLWRNNVGCLQDKRGSYVRYGVCNPGGSDIIGITKGGLLVCIETKVGRNKATPEQRAFIDIVLKLGGKAGVAYSIEEAGEIIAS
jgi:hypothetical protein